MAISTAEGDEAWTAPGSEIGACCSCCIDCPLKSFLTFSLSCAACHVCLVFSTGSFSSSLERTACSCTPLTAASRRSVAPSMRHACACASSSYNRAASLNCWYIPPLKAANSSLQRRPASRALTTQRSTSPDFIRPLPSDEPLGEGRRATEKFPELPSFTDSSANVSASTSSLSCSTTPLGTLQAKVSTSPGCNLTAERSSNKCVTRVPAGTTPSFTRRNIIPLGMPFHAHIVMRHPVTGVSLSEKKASNSCSPSGTSRRVIFQPTRMSSRSGFMHTLTAETAAVASRRHSMSL
mmetsp:Transcript_43798/g.115695  ORF Transcript_43798/g.115695 Transcript_43798/m.115695 type:complete len:294 (+) Transcript_43798:564-1445(+)